MGGGSGSFAGVQPGPDVAGFVIRVRFPKARMSSGGIRDVLYTGNILGRNSQI